MALAIKQLSKAARIILIGAPGVGKGTQTERLLAKFPQLASISSGDLLRENVRKKSPLGKQGQIVCALDTAPNNFWIQGSKQRPQCKQETSSPIH